MALVGTVGIRDVYLTLERGNLPLGKVGALVTASKERLRAQIAGLDADRDKVGQPGDALIGAKAIAAFLNELTSEAS